MFWSDEVLEMCILQSVPGSNGSGLVWSLWERRTYKTATRNGAARASLGLRSAITFYVVSGFGSLRRFSLVSLSFPLCDFQLVLRRLGDGNNSHLTANNALAIIYNHGNCNRLHESSTHSTQPLHGFALFRWSDALVQSWDIISRHLWNINIYTKK